MKDMVPVFFLDKDRDLIPALMHQPPLRQGDEILLLILGNAGNSPVCYIKEGRIFRTCTEVSALQEADIGVHPSLRRRRGDSERRHGLVAVFPSDDERKGSERRSTGPRRAIITSE